MSVTTIHRYIDHYKISPKSKRLIVGTIHPHQFENFNIDFFYGNVGSFWEILACAFPNQQFQTKSQILNTLSQNNIAVTDIIRKCDRESANVTTDAKLYNITDNDSQIRQGIVNSEIDTIYFTSRFGKNNAANRFVKAFGINYRQTFNEETSEFTIEPHTFGRRIRAVVLYSPSNYANKGIVNARPYLKNIDYYKQFENPIKCFKVEFYREKFNFFQL